MMFGGGAWAPRRIAGAASAPRAWRRVGFESGMGEFYRQPACVEVQF